MDEKQARAEAARIRKNERQKAYSIKTNYASQKKYHDAHRDIYKMLGFKLSTSKDGDIFEHVDKQPNKADYIRRLIRADIEASKK